MNDHRALRRWVTAAVFLGAFAAAGCGKQGALAQPAPIFGEKAKSDYAAKRQKERDDAAIRAGVNGQPAADQPDPNANDAPLTTRDVLDRSQVQTPASHQPIDGAPDPLGSPNGVRPVN